MSNKPSSNPASSPQPPSADSRPWLDKFFENSPHFDGLHAFLLSEQGQNVTLQEAEQLLRLRFPMEPSPYSYELLVQGIRNRTWVRDLLGQGGRGKTNSRKQLSTREPGVLLREHLSLRRRY